MFGFFFDFLKKEISQVPADTIMNTAMNISIIPIIPFKFRFSKTMNIKLHLYLNYLTGIFKKDLPNLVITETIGKVGITKLFVQYDFSQNYE